MCAIRGSQEVYAAKLATRSLVASGLGPLGRETGHDPEDSAVAGKVSGRRIVR